MGLAGAWIRRAGGAKSGCGGPKFRNSGPASDRL